jgi:hypothetical protein
LTSKTPASTTDISPEWIVGTAGDFRISVEQEYATRGVPGSLVGDEHIRNPAGDVELTLDAANLAGLILAFMLLVSSP